MSVCQKYTPATFKNSTNRNIRPGYWTFLFSLCIPFTAVWCQDIVFFFSLKLLLLPCYFHPDSFPSRSAILFHSVSFTCLTHFLISDWTYLHLLFSFSFRRIPPRVLSLNISHSTHSRSCIFFLLNLLEPELFFFKF